MMARCLIAALAWFVVLLGGACASSGGGGAPTAAARIPAEGVFVRNVRIRLAPAHTQTFEQMMVQLRGAATSANLGGPYDWMCYREPPCRYWLIFMNDRPDGFPYPAAPDALTGFARSVARRASEAELTAIDRLLADLEYEIEWDVLTRQKQAWSTVSDMSTATHPFSRVMVRTIRSGESQAFDEALTARTRFFSEHDYPLPIEGFVTISGAPGTAMQVVFVRDWPSFCAAESFRLS